MNIRFATKQDVPQIHVYISQGAIQMEGWTTNRVTAQVLVNLAKE